MPDIEANLAGISHRDLIAVIVPTVDQDSTFLRETCAPSPLQKRFLESLVSAKTASHRIRSISVIGGFLDGVRFDLADGLNCIIGARETGPDRSFH